MTRAMRLGAETIERAAAPAGDRHVRRRWDYPSMAELLGEAAERFELTEKGFTEKVVHPEHGKMGARIIMRLGALGIDPDWVGDNTRLTPEAQPGPEGQERRYVPDLFVVLPSNAEPLEDGRDYCGAPDLAIEILSGDERTADGRAARERDFVEKRAAYFRRGITHYWIADPITRRMVDGYELPERARSIPIDEWVLPW